MSWIPMNSTFFLLGDALLQEYIHIHFQLGDNLVGIILWSDVHRQDYSKSHFPIFRAMFLYRFVIRKSTLHALLIQITNLVKTALGIEHQYICLNVLSYHAHIIQADSNFTGFFGHCLFLLLKAPEISSAARNANVDKWHIFKLNFVPLPLSHGQHHLNFPPNISGWVEKTNCIGNNWKFTFRSLISPNYKSVSMVWWIHWNPFSSLKSTKYSNNRF